MLGFCFQLIELIPLFITASVPSIGITYGSDTLVLTSCMLSVYWATSALVEQLTISLYVGAMQRK